MFRLAILSAFAELIERCRQGLIRRIVAAQARQVGMGIRIESEAGRYDIKGLTQSQLQELNFELHELIEFAHNSSLISMLHKMTSDTIWSDHARRGEEIERRRAA